MSSLNFFKNEENTRHQARCSWCSVSTEYLARVEGRNRAKSLFDVAVESMGITEKGRVCSPECANRWREWARQRAESINNVFPIFS